MSEKEIITISNNPEYDRLLLNVGETLEQGRQQAVYAVNSAMVQTYWEIGRQIVEYEQHGNEKAEYGSDVLNRLSRDLTDRYGKGFSHSNVVYMRRLYLTYPKSQTLSDFYICGKTAENGYRRENLQSRSGILPSNPEVLCSDRFETWGSSA